MENGSEGAAAPADDALPPQTPQPPQPAAAVPPAAAAAAAAGAAVAAAAAAAAPPPGDSQQELQETLAKYKRLFSLARRSIEENQRQIAEKDAQLSGLRAQLEAAQKTQSRNDTAAGLTAAEPLLILRRVEEDGTQWVLLEYDGGGKGWKGFESEAELAAYARLDGAEPLRVPSASLAPEVSEQIMEEAKRQVARIREDFRKYRVRAELQAKQRDAEARLAAADSVAEKQRRIQGAAASGLMSGSIGGSGGGLGSTAGGGMVLGKAQALEEEVQRLQTELAEQDDMWRQAYEKQVRETEQLKRAGNEAALAAQWRQRYEQCVREKEDAQAKLQMILQGGSANGGGGGGGGGEALAALMQKYQDLKEEYKLYRKKAMAALAGSGPTGPDGAPAIDPKLQYLRNLVFKYLTTEDDGSRVHMERALATVLQFEPGQRKALEEIKEKRATRDVQWLSNLFSAQGAAGGTAGAAGGGRGLT